MFGSHLSVAGGMVNALVAADELGFDTVQVFTKNQRQWRVPDLKDSESREWLEGLKSRGWQRRTCAHATYLMNCASADAELWKKSAAMLATELERCAELSIPYLVAHPGAHLGEGLEAGARRIARACREVFGKGVGKPTVLCLENTAGGGSTMGRTFEELALVRRMIDEECQGDSAGRVGYCFDTCHALAAGYDLANHAEGSTKKRTRDEAEKAAQGVLDEFDRVCGLGNLKVVHLNDSKGKRGSRIDRHEHIGHGEVALGAFRAVVRRSELKDVPMILETPKEDDEKGRPWDTVNLGVLKRLMKA
ncbi:MAG: deoxyribonuclease IV [Phycisphaerales bacterium]